MATRVHSPTILSKKKNLRNINNEFLFHVPSQPYLRRRRADFFSPRAPWESDVMYDHFNLPIYHLLRIYVAIDSDDPRRNDLDGWELLFSPLESTSSPIH